MALYGRTEPDPVAVQRAIDGHRPAHLTVAEKYAAIRALHPRRCSDHIIAERLGLHFDTVGRIRRRLNLPAWPKNEQLHNRQWQVSP